MDRDELSLLAHRHRPVAAPLVDAQVERLLARAGVDAPVRILDLGCGAGGWVVRALRRWPDATAVGVDISGAALGQAFRVAQATGVHRRLALHEGPAQEYEDDEPFDLVLSVGSTHAFGGLEPTVAAVRGHLADGGRAIIGDGFWERKPTVTALKALEAKAEDHRDLRGTFDAMEATGMAVVDAHVSTPGEWDDYECSWSGSLIEWAVTNPDDPEAAEVAALARAHRDGWLRGYRGVLGFVTFVVRPAAT